MYRVIVVDDEPEIREGIISRMPWETLGFEVVGSADNGIDALELVDSLWPDLVLSDVKMPFMDGIRLAEEIRHLSPATKIILFSGFDDFEFAKRAIELNVVRYLLKPVNASELAEGLTQIKRQLDDERARQQDEARLQQFLGERLTELREQFLQNLLDGNTKHADLTAEATLLDLPMFAEGGGWYAVAYMGPGSGSGGQGIVGGYQLGELVTEQMAGQYDHIHTVRGDNLLTIVRLAERYRMLAFVKDFNTVRRYAETVLDKELAGGVGHPVQALERIAESSHEAFTAYMHSRAGDNHVLLISDIEPAAAERRSVAAQDWQQILRAVTLSGRDDAQTRVNLVLSGLEALTWTHAQLEELGIDLLSNVFDIMRTYDIPNEHVFDSGLNVLAQMTECRSIKTLTDWAVRIFGRLADAVGSRRKSSVERIAQEAKQFVEANYMDPNLSVDAICTELYVSAAYFSTVFKRQTNQTFVSYLTERRMREAKRLLETTDKKTYLIAEEVGYTEPNYFSYAFKKQFGLSPMQYRRQLKDHA